MSAPTRDGFLGIAVVVPGLVFQAQIERTSIVQAIERLKTALDSLVNDAENSDIDASDHASILMGSVIENVEQFSEGLIEEDEAISEISFAFLYAYMLNEEITSLDDIAGLVAGLDDEEIMFRSYQSDVDFRADTAEMRLLAESEADEDAETDTTALTPTLH